MNCKRCWTSNRFDSDIELENYNRNSRTNQHNISILDNTQTNLGPRRDFKTYENIQNLLDTKNLDSSYDKLLSFVNDNSFYDSLSISKLENLGYKYATDYLADHNHLVQIFMNYMKELPNIVKYNPYLHVYSNRFYIEPISVGNDDNIHNYVSSTWTNLEAQASLLSQAFLDGIPAISAAYLVRKQEFTPFFAFLQESQLLTNQLMIESHFQLSFCWWFDKMNLYDTFHWTAEKWSNAELDSVKMLKNRCQVRMNFMLSERMHVYLELMKSTDWNLNNDNSGKSLLLQPYEERGPVYRSLSNISQFGVGHEVRAKFGIDFNLKPLYFKHETYEFPDYLSTPLLRE
jgi:hypothetical protein